MIRQLGVRLVRRQLSITNQAARGRIKMFRPTKYIRKME
jgi:hypothetical protein